MRARGLTLGRALALALVAATTVAGVLVASLFDRWGDSLLEGSERLREAKARTAAAAVRLALGEAEASLGRLRALARSGALDADSPLAVERALFGELLANPDLAEATLTRARLLRDDPDLVLAPEGRWQVSVFRDGAGPSSILTTHTHERGGAFVADERRRGAGEASVAARPFARLEAAAADPTAHLTFVATARRHRLSDEPLWTDLHYAERDAHLPEERRRVVATVMQVVEDLSGRFLGVARVGLLAGRLDEIARIPVEAGPGDPHRVFLVDAEGRLVTRLRKDQPIREQGGDLRPAAGSAPEEVEAALSQPAVRVADADQAPRSARFEAGGRTYLLSVFDLAGAQDWRVAVLVPEDHYLGGLRRTRAGLLAASAAAVALLALAGAAGLRAVRLSLGSVVGSAARMRAFDFAPTASRSGFRDLAEVEDDLEQAKTALRALGKYVPIDLVRRLYRDRKEPALGGELRELTLFFSDIEGFTAIAERLPPDLLARVLGRYFAAVTEAIHASGGVVDKYIGDAVMALWNAPEPRPDHAARACAAALACRDAAARLAASPEWEGLPAFRTRFGLHLDRVMVGHFGAPDRLSYTALGDGVNLASRLEGLNRAYGTTILVGPTVPEAAGEAFVFRLVDLVAVKGRAQGVRVHELLGAAADVGPDLRAAALAYERAHEAYRERRFEEALAGFDALGDDPPSRVLAGRCRLYLREPPAAAWDGTHTAREK